MLVQLCLVETLLGPPGVFERTINLGRKAHPACDFCRADQLRANTAVLQLPFGGIVPAQFFPRALGGFHCADGFCAGYEDDVSRTC